MRKPALALGLALLAACVLPVLATQTKEVPPAAGAGPDRFGFDVQISPAGTDTPESMRRHYLCAGRVTRLGTGGPIFSPRVYALPGVQAGVSGTHEGIEFKATFLVDGTTARYTIEGKRNGEVVLSNTGTVQLAEKPGLNLAH